MLLRVIDIETTGLKSPAEIIEFGWVDVTPGVLNARWRDSIAPFTESLLKRWRSTISPTQTSTPILLFVRTDDCAAPLGEARNLTFPAPAMMRRQTMRTGRTLSSSPSPRQPGR